MALGLIQTYPEHAKWVKAAIRAFEFFKYKSPLALNKMFPNVCFERDNHILLQLGNASPFMILDILFSIEPDIVFIFNGYLQETAIVHDFRNEMYRGLAAMAYRDKEQEEEAKFDTVKYAEFFKTSCPVVPKTNIGYEHYIKIIKPLFESNPGTKESTAYLELLTVIVNDFERNCYELPKVETHEMIQHLMALRQLRNKDLERTIGKPNVVSMIVTGSRPPSKSQVEKLVELFKVKSEFFIVN